MSESETSPTTYVGYIWIDDQPFRVKIAAASLDEAIAAIKAQHGDSHVVSLWREPERPTTKLYVGYAWIGDAPGIRLKIWGCIARRSPSCGEGSVRRGQRGFSLECTGRGQATTLG